MTTPRESLSPADILGPAGTAAGGHMAHLVKWWKARFFSGYKQFSVGLQDGADGRASDTEELLRRPQRSPSPHPDPDQGAETDLVDGDDGVSAAGAGRERTPSQERAARRERLPSPGRGERAESNPAPAPPSAAPRHHHINFEEFECDVSVEGGVDEAGQERQEFSFTLYDFDGHGKITKDDITGLVSTIYETLGASIRVPHYGSKTIKVKLTVSPDKRCRGTNAPGHHNHTPGAGTGAPSGTGGGAGVGASPGGGGTAGGTARVRFKRDLNVTIQERRPLAVPRSRPRRTCSLGAGAQPSVRRRPSATQREREREPSEDRGYVVHSCSSSCRSGVGSDGGDVSADDEDVEDDEEEVEVPRRSARLSSGLSPASVAAAAATAATVASAACTAAKVTGSPQTKKRSSSMQRQELLQIIQANMEKNNMCFQTTKKSCGEGRGDRTGLEERRHTHSGVRHRQRHSKSGPQVSLSASASPQRIYDYATTPYYVNLTDKGEALTGDADTYRYVVCSPKHVPMYHNLPYRDRGHHRSRSHDLTANTHAHAHTHAHSHTHNPAAPLFRYTLLQEDTSSSVQACPVKQSRTAQSPACNRRTRLPPTAVGHTSSPHHLKHRNREQDQARAMAQVVQWLEQEFSASLNTRSSAGVQEVLINAKTHRAKSKSAAFNSLPDTPVPPPPAPAPAAPQTNTGSPLRPPPGDDTPAGTASGVKQHEHHHVHEHIHHHYHHYQDTPPVLV